MHPLTCEVKTYDWGSREEGSFIRELLAGSAPGSLPASGSPTAELWMGDHPSGPSLVSATGQPLASVLGGGSRLPFLFKVLCISKALSIQAHPDKALAERLHKADPVNYKDDNHKPEVAVALGEFHALVGFAPFEEIAKRAREVPELAEIAGHEVVAAVTAAAGEADPAARAAAVRRLFSAVMRSDSATAAAAVNKLAARVKASSSSSSSSSLSSSEIRAEQLSRDYPGDVGVLVSLLMNYVVLREGQGVFLAANEPHAYVRGNCIECMATSDNVVRGGLTPKFKDVDTLCSMLTYQLSAPAVMEGNPVDAHTTLYPSPVPEFVIWRTRCEAGEAVTLGPCPSPAIVVVLEGHGTMSDSKGGSAVEYKKGSIILFQENAEVKLAAGAKTHLFRATSNFMKQGN
jgi:mannose-6-phosphate isomerase